MSEEELAVLHERFRRLQEEYEAMTAAFEQRATFLSTMSHELREPMNGVLGMARFLAETDLDEEQKSFTDGIVSSAEALLTIINDILDLSRIDSGRVELINVDFAARPFFDRLSTILKSRAASKNLDFDIELSDDLPVLLRGDPGRVRQILINLAGNAIKFTSQGYVKIICHLRSMDDVTAKLDLSVEDTGIGIPPEQRDKVFAAFSQADSTVPRLYGGSGLGLMIVQRLVHAMGGSISVSSREGGGTIFNFDLCLARATGEERSSGGGRGNLAGTSMLLVDPVERSRSIIMELSKLWHIDVRTALSAKEAFTIMQEAVDRGKPFDFLIADQNLPDDTGIKLIERIKNIPGIDSLHATLLVSSGMRGEAAKAHFAGYNAYLPKPVTPSTLLDCLQQLQGSEPGGSLVTIHSLSENKRPTLRILVADDNLVNLKLAAIMLERTGHEVITAMNGAEAVEALKNGYFDAVLMDIQMPVMNGLDAARAIRRLDDPRRSQTPIIAITANAMQGDDQPCYEAGMNGYVTKPIDKASLLGELESVIAA